MRRRTLIGITAIVSIEFAAPTVAQQPWGSSGPSGTSLPSERLSYAQKKSRCYREGGLRKELSGDALTQFMTACMQEDGGAKKPPAGAEADQQRRCRGEGEFERGLKGSQLDSFITQCIGR
jgi:hypothetical protein